jgi:hypothetical protein
MRPRAVEFRLLAFALALVLVAMELVDLDQAPTMVWPGWVLALVFAALAGVPTGRSGAGRRTPTRSCCPVWRCSTVSA